MRNIDEILKTIEISLEGMPLTRTLDRQGKSIKLEFEGYQMFQRSIGDIIIADGNGIKFEIYRLLDKLLLIYSPDRDYLEIPDQEYYESFDNYIDLLEFIEDFQYFLEGSVNEETEKLEKLAMDIAKEVFGDERYGEQIITL